MEVGHRRHEEEHKMRIHGARGCCGVMSKLAQEETAQTEITEELTWKECAEVT
jgi:hypothetical protein